MAFFQPTFFAGPHSRGSLVSFDNPCPVGPRNSGQSAARRAPGVSPGRTSPASRRAGVTRLMRVLLRGPLDRLGLDVVGGAVAGVGPAAAGQPADGADGHVV